MSTYNPTNNPTTNPSSLPSKNPTVPPTKLSTYNPTFLPTKAANNGFLGFNIDENSDTIIYFGIAITVVFCTCILLLFICVICCRRQIKQRRILTLRLTKMNSGSNITVDSNGVMDNHPRINMSDSINYQMSTGRSSTALVCEAETHAIDGQPPVPPPSSVTTDDYSSRQPIIFNQQSMINIQQQQQQRNNYSLPVAGYSNNVPFAGAMNFNMNMNNMNYNTGMYPMNNNFNGMNVIPMQQSQADVVRIKPGQSFLSTVPSSNDADVDTDITVITSEQSMSELTSVTGFSVNTINILHNIIADDEKAVSEYAGMDSHVCDTNTNSSVGVGENSSPHVKSYMEMLLENPSLGHLQKKRDSSSDSTELESLPETQTTYEITDATTNISELTGAIDVKKKELP